MPYLTVMKINRGAWKHLLACATIAAVCLTVSASPDTPGGEPRSDEGILELLPGVSTKTVLDRYGFTLLDSIHGQQTILVSFRLAMTDNEFEALFLNDADIEHSELNFASGDPGPGTQSTFLGSVASAFEVQPAFVLLGTAQAHAASTGTGVTVAVIDSGVDTEHPFFASRIHPASRAFAEPPVWASASMEADTVPSWPPFHDGANGLDDDGDGLIDEMQGHGTWVSGLILGVAPDAQIMALRVLNDEGYTTAFQVAKAMHHAMDYGAHVINLSLSSLEDLRITDKAGGRANDLGVIVVAAAGNQNSERTEFPAGTNHVAGVSAVDTNGVRASFSNYGRHLLVAAPGIDLVGPIPGGWGRTAGTSGATPLVAGAAALAVDLGLVRRYENFREMMKKTTIDIEPMNPQFDDLLGFGMLDLAAAVRWEGPCFADIVEDDILDEADVEAYISLYAEGDLEADFVNPRGQVDLADLLFFFDAFAAGCPE